MYYESYIHDRVEEAFDYEDAEFALFDSNHNDHGEILDEQLNEQIFHGAMCEMVSYIFEREREVDGEHSKSELFDSENVDNIYITSMELEAPTVIVEYHDFPEWLTVESADLREFYWHPRPALSGEWTAGYFQFR